MFHEDSWLAGIIDAPVYKIDTAGQNPAEIASLVQAHAAQQGKAFYFAKVETTQVELVRQLGAAGMYVVDVNTLFRLDPPFQVDASPLPVKVVQVEAQHTEDVLRIAGSCFRFSRFHLDPLIPDAMAHRIKRDWIENYVLGKRGCALLVALINQQPVGFLAVLASEMDGKQVRTIDLVGVDSAHQGQRIGEALVKTFITAFGRDASILQVGTQAANIPSMRLYEKLGFRMASTSYVLHMHVGV
jgi:ribosomal protein S18 acetylase RimI-like enzyme